MSTQKQATARQHDALDTICVKVFEEKVSGELVVQDRPGLDAALEYIRHGDMLAAQESSDGAATLLRGSSFSTICSQRGIAVKVLDGIAAGEHTERSLILDLALGLAKDRRRDIARKTRNGLEAAPARGKAEDEIYPDIWAESQVFDSYLLPNLTELRRLYAYAGEESTCFC